MMRVTLANMVFSSEPIPDENGIVIKLINLDGWYSSAPIRAEITDLPGADGGFAPARIFRSSKAVTISGVQYGGTAQQAVEMVWEQLAALSPDGRSMTLTVEDESSVVKSMNVYLTSNPQVVPYRNNGARFQVIVTAPDPRKYGAEVSATAKPSGTGSGDGLRFPLFTDGFLDFGPYSPSGLFYVTNIGTAESWPIFKVSGSIGSPGFEILSDEQVIKYSASVPAGAEVILSPYAGGRASIGGVDVTQNLVIAQWPSIKPGEQRAYIFNPLGVPNANARVTSVFSSAWW